MELCMRAEEEQRSQEQVNQVKTCFKTVTQKLPSLDGWGLEIIDKNELPKLKAKMKMKGSLCKRLGNPRT
eukprot:5991339-Prorocentrum_lima.AAC.1